MSDAIKVLVGIAAVRSSTGRAQPGRFRLSGFGLLSAFGLRISDFLPTLFLALAFAPSPAAFAQNLPHLAYVYPAGGRQGTTFEVTVGGQFLRNVANAYVSDPGIQATVVEYNRPMNQKEFKELREQLTKLLQKRQRARRFPSGTNVWTAADQQKFTEIRNKILKNPPNRRANPAMAETVLLRISIPTNTAPGEYEIRLRAPYALSNPLNFFVGQCPEYSKPPAKAIEPALNRFLARLGQKPASGTPTSDLRIALPAVVNGQIMPGGVDRYRFRARRGQQLVIRVSARALIPYLADAVPGWFEATATVYDAQGRELAYGDRFRFRPDPVIHFTVPHDGAYSVAIHDSIYRGREDFVYRMTIGELPFLTDIFPLGGPAGAKTTLQLAGWNLPTHALTLDNTGSKLGVASVSVSKDGRMSNPMPFAVDTLPECLEKEPDNSPETAQSVALPIIINGRIDAPGDEDVFRFAGRAGERIVAEVLAHRLGSPLDSTLELADAAGKPLAFNDDYNDKGAGLETDHADSYLAATLPADGTYFIRLRDAQQHGGPAYAYRLRISRPRPDFELRVVPSSLTFRAGLSVPVTVYALRRDGFTNAINLRLHDAPPGFSLSGARIPANQDQAQFTLNAPPRPPKAPISLSFEGVAVVAGQATVRPAVPADDRMQAFAYWHLVPARKLEAALAGNPRPFAGHIRILSTTPVRVPIGGTARVHIAVPWRAFAQRFDLELGSAPGGIAIQNTTPVEDGMEVTLSCSAEKGKRGARGNLIMNIVPKPRPNAQRAGRRARPRLNPVGALPAVPLRIIDQTERHK